MDILLSGRQVQNFQMAGVREVICGEEGLKMLLHSTTLSQKMLIVRIKKSRERGFREVFPLPFRTTIAILYAQHQMCYLIFQSSYLFFSLHFNQQTLLSEQF